MNTPTPKDDHEAYAKWLHKHMAKKGRAAGQIDSLMESGTGLLLFEVWEAAKDECKRELTAVTEQRDRLAEALERIGEEDGSPMSMRVCSTKSLVKQALQSLNQPDAVKGGSDEPQG